MRKLKKMLGLLGLAIGLVWNTIFAQSWENTLPENDKGLLVIANSATAELAKSLHSQNGYLVNCLFQDKQKVDNLRKELENTKLYGTGITSTHWTEETLPFIDNLVNVLVVDNVSVNEIDRILAPYGIVFTSNSLETELKEKGYAITKLDNLIKATKPYPENIDEWTHYLHGANNNAVAQDTVIDSPGHLQWVSEPKWDRSHEHLPNVRDIISSGGRLFSIVDQGHAANAEYPPKWFLVARNAFNGILLWKKSLSTWEDISVGRLSGTERRMLVAIKDNVYTILGYGKPLVKLNALTGNIVKSYENTENVLEFVYDKGVLFLVLGSRNEHKMGITKQSEEDCHQIVAIQAETGEVLWKTTKEDTGIVLAPTLCSDKGKVFFQNGTNIVCLNAESGNVNWKNPRKVTAKFRNHGPTLVIYKNVLLAGQRGHRSKNTDNLTAYSAENGTELWKTDIYASHSTAPDILVIDDLVWTGKHQKGSGPGFRNGLDFLTGEIKRTLPPDSKYFKYSHHHRCYRDRATNKFLLLGREGIEFIDIKTGEGRPNAWVRGACMLGILPCNGLIYVPPHPCHCYPYEVLRGFYALAPQKKNESPEKQSTVSGFILEQGNAYEVKENLSTNNTINEWRTYRSDGIRSGYTKMSLSSKLQQKWNINIGGKLSSLVSAENKIFVAQVDKHSIHAQNGDTGEDLWTFIAGGRIDSPPTIYKGLVYFGSADGWVYCLRSSDGELVWRFHSTGKSQNTISYNQIESLWPIHGSVLIQNDTVCFVAGRTAFLDGGMFVYRLNPLTGKIISKNNVTGFANTGLPIDKSKKKHSHHPDIPVADKDGKTFYIGHLRFDDKCKIGNARPHIYSTAGLLDDKWWHRMYWRIGYSAASGFPSWGLAGKANSTSGRILVTDGNLVYGYGRDDYWGIGGGHLAGYKTGKKISKIHYHLFSTDWYDRDTAEGTGKIKKKALRGIKSFHWTERIPIQARAMVLADKTLFIAGPVDVIDTEGFKGQNEAWEGKRDIFLMAISTLDGKEIGRYKLDSLPIWDGMIVANKKLYMSMKNGEILCFKEK